MEYRDGRSKFYLVALQTLMLNNVVFQNSIYFKKEKIYIVMVSCSLWRTSLTSRCLRTLRQEGFKLEGRQFSNFADSQIQIFSASLLQHLLLPIERFIWHSAAALRQCSGTIFSSTLESQALYLQFSLTDWLSDYLNPTDICSGSCYIIYFNSKRQH